MQTQPMILLDHNGKPMGHFPGMQYERPAAPESMEDFATELAVALGVEDESNRFEQLFLGPQENLVKGFEMVAGRVRPLLPIDSRRFEAIFASRYLPKLFEAACSTLPSLATRRRLDHYDELLWLIATGSQFGAYARSSMAPASFDRLVDRLVEEMPSVEELANGSVELGTTSLSSRQGLKHRVFTVHCLLSQTTQSFGTPYSSTIASLDRQVQLLKSSATHQMLMKAGVPKDQRSWLDESAGHLRKIVAVMKQVSTMGDELIATAELVSFPWVGCEANVVAEESIELWKFSECEELKEGAELEACGRCKIVRYCGKAHQRSHWKLHKKTCIKPLWL